MTIFYERERVQILPQNDQEREVLNKLVADSESSKELMVWWGDMEYDGKEEIGINISAPYTPETLGMVGGNVTKAKHPEHFKTISKKGVEARWGKITTPQYAGGKK